MRLRKAILGCALLGAVILTPLAISSAQVNAKRLILKDGSYQLASKWEIKGDRVRYFSAERADWEELPNALVDWDATDQYEKDRVAGRTSPVATELGKERK